MRSQAALASVEAAAGNVAASNRILEMVLSNGYMDHHVAYSIGAAYAQLGMIDRSVEWLERAAATGFSCYPSFARDPLLVPLQREPSFRTLLARLSSIATQTALRPR
jgi:hypothetical protein